MAKFRRKTVLIDAVQLPAIDEDASQEVIDFITAAVGDGVEFYSDRDGVLEISTPEGTVCGDPLDWLIRGGKGEIKPCKPDIFEATYEPVTGGVG